MRNPLRFVPFLLACASFAYADANYFLNKKDTLHPDGKHFDDLACYYCDREKAPIGKCGESAESGAVYRVEDFLVDPLEGDGARKWMKELFMPVTSREKELKKIYEKNKEGVREKEVKKALCSAPVPAVSQVFYLTYPKPAEAVPMDEWAKTRQDLLKLTEIRVKWYYAKGAEGLKNNLSCLKENLESATVLESAGGHFFTPKLGSARSMYGVREGGKEYFDVVFDQVFTRKAIFRTIRYVHTEKNDMYSRTEADLPLDVEDFAVFEADGGVKRSHHLVEGKYTRLKLTRSWLMNMLSTHFAFIEKGKKISQSVSGMSADWMRYALSHSSVLKEELPKENRVKLTLTLDLKGFCKTAEPLHDLTTH